MPRQARGTRPQLVCILADDSRSMAGAKAQAATLGIRDMIMECQSRGPSGPERSYFKLLLIRFDEDAAVDPRCDMTPIRKIDPERVSLEGRGHMTNITDALELTLKRLRPYMKKLQKHPERADHPLPLVLLFSDGVHNVGPPPQPVAEAIKSLELDGEGVTIATAAVSVGDRRLDETTLKEIASPGCHVHITRSQALTDFISTVGSSAASHARDIARIIEDFAE